MIGKKVTGSGPLTSRILLCGEGPGRTEAEEGIPFCGASGSELDWLFLMRGAKIPRQSIYVTNIVKWRTDEEDSDPTAEDIARDEAELLAEIIVVSPEIIVAVGKVAANWFMLSQNVDMVKYHGLPLPCPRYPDKTLFITFHPAAGLRLPAKYYQLIFWDFQQLGKFYRGELQQHQTRYFPWVEELNKDHVLESTHPVAFDTEGLVHNPWGMSFSHNPSFGGVVAHGSISLSGHELEAHNILHDADVIAALGEPVDLDKVHDTMLMANLLPWTCGGIAGQKSLKPLMYRIAGIEQESYEDLIKDPEAKIAKEYILRVLGEVCPECNGVGTVPVPYKRQPDKFKQIKCDSCSGDGTSWPKPTPQLIFNDDGVGRVYKPRSLGRTLRAALERGDRLTETWGSVPEEIRSHVESKLGRMKEVSLDDVEPRKRAIHYSGIDACGTRAIAIDMRKTLKEDGLERVYKMDRSIVPIIHKMHKNGILLDKEYFAQLGKEFEADRKGILDKLQELSGVSNFNPSSPLQVAKLLYDTYKLKAYRGSRSTDEKTMETLKIKYKDGQVAEAIDAINEYRELTKLLGTYIYPLPAASDSGDRVHTQFLLHVTTSGRLSSRDPNLQNIPTRSERGKRIRAGFISRSGCRLVSVDLDQIELRVGAHLAEDENMIEIFKTGQDIHLATAALCYGKPASEITSDERRAAKTVNFGIFYGMSARRLYNELSLMGVNVSLDDCVGFINDWFKAYPGVRQYMDRCYAQAKSVGYVECLFGRRRYLPGVHSTIDHIREEALRWAVNHPDQGTAAGILKLWMRAIWDNLIPAMERKGYCEPLLTIHDEVIFEVQEGLEDEVIEWAVYEAANVIDLLVPISAKGGSGHNWAELKG